MYRVDFQKDGNWHKITSEKAEDALFIASLISARGFRVEVWNGTHLLFEGN